MPDSWFDYLASIDHDDEDSHHLDMRVLREVRRRQSKARIAARQPRHCPRCEKDRTVADFGPNAARPDGLQSWCRDCRD
jgi:hypothetical protein